MHHLAPYLWSLPWIIPPVFTWFRVRNSRSLDDESDIPPESPPLVSVIVPARNEAHNIAPCVTSILATTYPNLELIVVDDSSTDGTPQIARDAAQRDPRARFITAPPLPEGWFGKQWACTTGAKVARGSVLQFTDADTVHGADLVTRSINAMRRVRAQLFSVAGRQELGGFWEKVMQPQIFTILAMRYGGTESITEATNVRDKIANGQCIFVTHDSYNAIGGHASVRTSVAEDMMLAQRFYAARKRVVVMLGPNQLSTRMYGSLREIISGWRKNVFAGGLDSVPFGKVGQTMFPLFLLMPPLMQLLPVLALVLAASGLATSSTLLVWAAISASATLLWWILVYVTIKENPLYALAYPLGALVLLYIFFTAVIRGRRVSWKGRTYISQ
ncbi:MAG TPA: glycosyltransferase family 2 protein [Gemmatimonadaceae bacterium]|nr:glycosyltransferase family 2 protein [Gemmatimonadaceae bacterium]